MKKIFTLILAALVSVAMWAEKQGGTLTSSLTPIDPSSAVVLSYDGTATNFAAWQPKCFIHTWLVAKEGQTFSKDYGTTWATCEGDGDYAALPDKVKMSFVSTGKYTITLTIKDFFDVAEADLAKIAKIGVIVRAQYSGDDNQTKDFLINVAIPDPTAAKFYVTGNSDLLTDAGSAAAEWTANAIESKKDTLILSGLKANVAYKLKVTLDGTWDTPVGFAALTEVADGLSEDHDGNICFTLTAAGNVKVIHTGTLFKLIGTFKPVAKRTIKLVPSEEWAEADAKFAAWIWGANIMSQWTSFFTPVSAGNDTLQAEIVANADSIDFVRFSPKASAPKWGTEGENVIVWGEMKDALYADSSVWTVIDWEHGQWTAYNRPCQEFGLLIDGVYRKAKHNVNQTEWLEYMLRGVDLTAGQKLQICNPCDDSAKWVITKYANTSYELSFEGDGANKKYVISKSGKYDFYFKFIYGNDEIYISKEGEYTTAVRDQCTDVMMQAFYNESYDNSKPGVNDEWQIGDTKWNTLYGQADSIGRYFDLIWLPPSANGDGAGYHPKNYSNQSSNWGTGQQLKALINKFHETGTKVIADIVINHCQSSSGWMGFPEFNFGSYGRFQPKGSWICQNDEANTDPGSDSQGQATGPYDDGENWSGARDWAHSNVEVQAMFKAYLQFMRDSIGYDGWRYDKGDGFNNWHHDNYNKASNPYIAFMECYSGTDEIKWRIEQANYNLMALDFGTKWDVFNSFAGWNYGCYRGGGLLGQNWGRYAVEFIDSHDWFLRPDNENEFGGRGNSLTETMKCRLLQANAFLLSMPGIPCVFYPHWKKYDGFLKPMIQARKLAGVHSESEVKDEKVDEGGTGYQATIVGKYGYLILCLGTKAHQDFSADYDLMASYYETNDAGLGKDGSYQIWVNRTAPLPTAVEEVEEQPVKAEKFFQNGQLFIRLGDKVYNVLGNTIK